ncbi:MAG: hypothetical protein AAF439_04575 [Pseudomonadota bacterium]
MRIVKTVCVVAFCCVAACEPQSPADPAQEIAWTAHDTDLGTTRRCWISATPDVRGTGYVPGTISVSFDAVWRQFRLANALGDFRSPRGHVVSGEARHDLVFDGSVGRADSADTDTIFNAFVLAEQATVVLPEGEFAVPLAGFTSAMLEAENRCYEQVKNKWN